MELRAPLVRALAARLDLPSLVEHSPERLHLLLDHLCGGLTANERISMTESVPEIVYFVGLLADERCGAGVRFSLLQSFAEYLFLRR